MPGTRRSVYITTRRPPGSASLKIHRLLDAGAAAVAGAVGQVLAAARRAGRRTGRRRRLHRALPSARLIGLPLAARARLRAGLVDHVGMAAAEFGQLRDVVGREAGGLDDGADRLGRSCPGSLATCAPGSARARRSSATVRVQADRRSRVRARCLSPCRAGAGVLRLGVGLALTARASTAARPLPPSAPFLDQHGLVAGV